MTLNEILDTMTQDRLGEESDLECRTRWVHGVRVYPRCDPGHWDRGQNCDHVDLCAGVPHGVYGTQSTLGAVCAQI
jgi:hypothetical protein